MKSPDMKSPGKNGYLHRIASSVLHPQSAIHPFVGTVWTPQRNFEPTETAFEISSRATTPAEQHTPAAIHLQPAPLQRHRENAAHREHNASTSDTETVTAPIASFLVTPPQFTQNSKTAFDSEQETESNPQANNSQPLVVRAQPLVSPPRESSVFPSVPLAKAPRADFPRRTPPAPTREPDEIEINIGRIEVIAAQPPQTTLRPQPRTTRKSLDLSEYLARGGRTR